MPASHADTCFRVPPSHTEAGSDDWRKLEEWKQQQHKEWKQRNVEETKQRHLEEWKQRCLAEWNRQPAELKQQQLREWSLRQLKALRQQRELEEQTEGSKSLRLSESAQWSIVEWQRLNLEKRYEHLEVLEDHQEDRSEAQLASEPLPFDPREWTRAHVRRWLRAAAARHGLAVRASRFLMNGKALCLMTREMYARRVPAGGALLHADFRRRLARALT